MIKKGCLFLILTSQLSGCVFPELSSSPVYITNAAEPIKKSQSKQIFVLPEAIPVTSPDFEKIKLRVPKAPLVQTIQQQIESLILETGNQLTDRTGIAQTDQMIRSEILQVSPNLTALIPSSDYMIYPRINVEPLTSRFEQGYQYKGRKGELQSVPTTCFYAQTVKVTAHIYDVKADKEIAAVDMIGKQTATITPKVPTHRCPMSQAHQQAMIVNAARKAVLYHKNDVANYIKPVGPVLQLRKTDNGDSYLVKIALGTSNNVKAKMEIEFSRLKQGKAYKLGVGYIINNPDAIQPNYAWVTVKKELAQHIQRGDMAAPIYDICTNNLAPECMFESYTNLTQMEETAL
ncbi:hypothetical protein F9817_13715 [Vibrio sp. CAIM 722]|uniref:Uncharacterized protein n=1 Tax=Vibrio eleionomae TaxID=2653505 RepID=A0A7X4RVF3_9VIBR|nr:hypothetical protein [Vibrio eleionomae]MZI94252.1 hypothetical protein [Vibrio eleionomae]